MLRACKVRSSRALLERFVEWCLAFASVKSVLVMSLSMRQLRPTLLFLFTSLLVACSSSEPSPTPEATAPPQADSPAPSTPAQAPSPLPAVQAILSSDGPTSLAPSELMSEASKLDAWAATQPKDQATKAAILSAELQLLALATAKSKEDLESPRQTLLRRIATQPLLSESNEVAALEVKEAALAILGLDTEVKDVRINRGAAMTLAASTGIAGQAVRTAWLERTTRALDAWAKLPAELRASSAVPLSGRMLCPRCADAHHITPDKVVPLLLGEGNAGGLICDRAIAAGSSAASPNDYIGALSLCEELWPSDALADPGLFWGLNTLVIGLLRTAHSLSLAPVPSGPLKALLNERLEALKVQLSRPWVLPTALISAPKRAPDQVQPLMFIPNLGGAGLSTAHAPLGVLSLGPDGLRIGLRPTLSFEEGKLVSLSLRSGLPAGGRLVLSLEQLRAAPRDAKGEIEALSSAANEALKAASTIHKALGHEARQATGLTLALDAEATSADVNRTLAALHAAGVGIVHVLKSASHGHTLPLMIRQESSGTRTILETEGVTAYERPMLAVVAREHVDIWAPEKALNALPEKPYTGRPPVGTTLSYKGKSLKRIRVPIADPESGLTSAGLDLFNKAAGYFMRRDNSAPLMHVIASQNSRAADVLLVARRFQEREGKALKTPHVFWPGTSCGGKVYRENRRTPNDCASAIAVAFSAFAAPSGRGLSSRPAGSKLSKTSEPEPDAPAPSGDAFCDKKDIKVAMNRAKGSFRFCYQRELQNNPELSGRVVLRFTIGTDGRPKGPAIASSTLKNKEAHACLLKTVTRMTFKPPKGGVCPVRWPFTFKPR